MTEKSIYKLKIDPQYEKLIPPLSAEEFKYLEENIKRDGCREPLCIWKKTIIDGHNRYKICTANNIPFHIQEIEFNSKEDAIDWICINQLGRRNISEDTKRYLIGKRYEAEKVINARKNPKGVNQYTVQKTDEKTSNRERTASALAREYNVASTTVRKYAYYSRTIDKLAKKNPELVPEIFKGNIKISYESMCKLNKKHSETIKNIKKELDKKLQKNISYSELKKMLPDRSVNPIQVKVKETPVYDPDADISSLAYTIPAWVSSLERTFSLVDFNKITPQARSRVQNELKKLKETIDIMLEATEVKNG